MNALIEKAKIQVEIKKCEGIIKDKEQEIDSLMREVNQKEGSLSNSLDKKRISDLELYLREGTSELNTVLEQINEEGERLKQEYLSLLDSSEVEDRLNVSTSEVVNEKVLETLDIIQDQCSNYLGLEVYERYYKSLKVDVVSSEEFITTLDSLPKQGETLFKIKKLPIVSVLDSMKSNTGENAKVVTGMLILTAPIYLTLASVNMALGLFMGSKFKEYIYSLKLVKENISKFEQALREKVLREHEEFKLEVENWYNSEVDIINERRSKILLELSLKKSELERNFQFNDSTVMNVFNMQRQDLLNKIDSAKEFILLKNEDLKKLEIKLDEICKEIVRNGDTIRSTYFSIDKFGDSYVFPDKFLLEIKDSNPKFLEMNLGSSLFIIEEDEDFHKIVSSLVVQLRSLMRPSLTNCILLDTVHLGGHLNILKLEGKENLASFNIVSSYDEFKNTLNTLSDLVRSRGSNILSTSSKDINEYNKDMVSFGSVPEIFKVLFLLGAEKLLTSGDLDTIIKTGPKLGVIPMVFTSYNKLELLKDKLSLFGNFYEFRGGNLNPRILSFLEERISSSKNSP